MVATRSTKPRFWLRCCTRLELVIALCRERSSEGGYAMPTALYIDAPSVFAACTATPVKMSADNAMLPHVQYIREQLDTKVVTALVWVDTRDMLAIGVTKGVGFRQSCIASAHGWNCYC